MRIQYLSLPILALALAGPAFGRTPQLAQPIDCTLGESCFIQNYVDADPGPGGADFTCGPLSYDGHKGTDFALTSMAAMEAGVAVLAAAPGKVTATRDGMADTGRDGTPAEVLDGKDCGNGIVINHGGGWETQYCHLREGSVAVAKGDRVAMGAMLGQVGYSGQTQFPHLHISVRKDGKVVDPFNTDEITTCGEDDGPQDDLWTSSPDYVAGGLIAVGMATGVPSYEDVKSGAARHDVLPAKASALVGWAYVFGGRSGDFVEITLTDPEGKAFYSGVSELTRTQAQLMRAMGKKIPASGRWVHGDWTVRARLLREGVAVDEGQASVRVEN